MAGKRILTAKQLNKSYGPVTALQSVDIDIYEGELVAIVGDNGAGKSTLIKILSGVVQPDSGTIEMDNKPVSIRSPKEAAELGIETVYQDLALAPNLDVAGNVYLGREPIVKGLGSFFGIVNRRSMIKRVEEELRLLEVNIPSVNGLEVGSMSGGQRQAVAIARSAVWASRILLMDEPTAALGVRESEAVLRLVQRIRQRGISVVMISHILPHVIQLADRVIVMRQGSKIAELTSENLSHDRLIAMIVGYEAGEVKVVAE
ncbi:MAG: sugar ABC transporter ATP-binding protein [Anaerolineae bacterium]|nr:sugar ABC transporter ATP-binding protein [Anaerolineae bacterium]